MRLVIYDGVCADDLGPIALAAEFRAYANGLGADCYSMQHASTLCS